MNTVVTLFNPEHFQRSPSQHHLLTSHPTKPVPSLTSTQHKPSSVIFLPPPSFPPFHPHSISPFPCLSLSLVPLSSYLLSFLIPYFPPMPLSSTSQSPVILLSLLPSPPPFLVRHLNSLSSFLNLPLTA